MTEKQYGGAADYGFKDIKQRTHKEKSAPINSYNSPSQAQDNPDSAPFPPEMMENYKKAGQIAKQAVLYARSLIKPEMPLLEIAEKVESKIIELGGKPAFPVNLSINEIAAHSTPLQEDTSTAKGLLKVDIGVHIKGCIADTSFSMDMENSEKNKKLIRASEDALKEACSMIKAGVQIRAIGKTIEDSIHLHGFQPIQNLSGHSIEPYDLHAGTTIPNVDNAQEKPLAPGVYAIEPFATSGIGSVKDGKPSSIYVLSKSGNVRDLLARQILKHIEEEYKTLPFCLRWLIKKFGTRAANAMQRIEEAGLVHRYSQLIESGREKVAQAEHTIIITEREKIITTL